MAPLAPTTLALPPMPAAALTPTSVTAPTAATPTVMTVMAKQTRQRTRRETPGTAVQTTVWRVRMMGRRLLPMR